MARCKRKNNVEIIIEYFTLDSNQIKICIFVYTFFIDISIYMKTKTKTKKRHGGDIDKKNIFRKILSIGYELESSSLAKFSLIDESNDHPILLNSDSLPKDFNIIKNIQNDDFTEEEFDYYENRLEEFYELKPYTTESINKNVVNKLIEYNDTTFIVSNDLSTTPFTKYLKKICDLNPDEEEETEDLIDKNELYTFESEDGKIFKINFETWQKKHCGMLSDVEWIVTYYNPKKSKNIILDTFINVAKNLILHLSNLQKQKGNLVMNFTEDKEIVKNPQKRILYNLPNTNLYYLQTHYINEELDIDDICFVPQMTFSSRIEDLVDILKELSIDSIQLFENNARISNERVQLIDRIEKCIHLLFQNYNNSAPDEYKIRDDKNKTLIKSINNYIFMILFKLERYFNNYLVDEKVLAKSSAAKYLKDTLFFNSRHINYDLYKSLKKSISEYFQNSIAEDMIIAMIKKIIIQNTVLEEYLITNKENIRKNAFLITNKLDKSNKHYGNPHYSLVSYFDFFEDPIDSAERRDANDKPFNDWLQYNSIDIFSSTMEIKNNIVLVEVRSFQRTLNTYMHSIANDEMKNSMINGICNRITKSFQPDAPGISISTLKQFVLIYEKLQASMSKFRSRSRSNVSKTMKTMKTKKID